MCHPPVVLASQNPGKHELGAFSPLVDECCAFPKPYHRFRMHGGITRARCAAPGSPPSSAPTPLPLSADITLLFGFISHTGS